MSRAGSKDKGRESVTMNKARKTELLYQKAKGRDFHITEEERRELSRYRVKVNEGSLYATRANISAYVTAVDHGCRISFYDWCMNHNKADRRRKGSSEAAMERSQRENSLAVMGMGWLIWGMALYWVFQETVSVAACAVLGAAVSVTLFKSARRLSAFTLFVLPIAIAAIFGS